jgi:hypothetical protein
VYTDSEVFEAESVIIATGAQAKWLDLPSEQALQNRGVSACATCDGYFFRNQDVAVVGGGDTAMEEANYLSGLVKSVTVIHRRAELRASKIMAERALKNPKIKFVWNSAVTEVHDVTAGKVTGISVKNLLNGEERLPVEGLFVAIGHEHGYLRASSTRRERLPKTKPEPPRPISKACSPPVTQTTCTDKRLPQQARAAWQRSKPNVGSHITSESFGRRVSGNALRFMAN